MNRRTILIALAWSACGGARAEDAPAPAAGKLEPWEPYDPAFKGCEGG